MSHEFALSSPFAGPCAGKRRTGSARVQLICKYANCLVFFGRWRDVSRNFAILPVSSGSQCHSMVYQPRPRTPGGRLRRLITLWCTALRDNSLVSPFRDARVRIGISAPPGVKADRDNSLVSRNSDADLALGFDDTRVGGPSRETGDSYPPDCAHLLLTPRRVVWEETGKTAHCPPGASSSAWVPGSLSTGGLYSPRRTAENHKQHFQPFNLNASSCLYSGFSLPFRRLEQVFAILCADLIGANLEYALAIAETLECTALRVTPCGYPETRPTPGGTVGGLIREYRECVTPKSYRGERESPGVWEVSRTSANAFPRRFALFYLADLATLFVHRVVFSVANSGKHNIALGGVQL